MKTATIIGRTSLDDGETTQCEHCGQDIRHLVYLSNGQTVGTQCALKKMGYSHGASSQVTLNNKYFLFSIESGREGTYCIGMNKPAMREYIIETRTAKTPWQREADSPAYSTRATAEHIAMGLEAVNDDGDAIEYRVREVEAAGE